MSWSRWWQCCCSRCGDCHLFGGEFRRPGKVWYLTLAAAKRRARRDGWKMRNGDWVCPGCLMVEKLDAQA
jgi:hypothetical protein